MNKSLKIKEEEKNILELCLIMRKLLPEMDNITYTVYSETKFMCDKIDMLVALKDESQRIKNLVSEGFYLFYELYDSEIVLDFYAKKLIKGIINDKDIDFETKLHSNNYSKEELDNFNITTYIINFISCYDSPLGAYVSTHLYIIDDLKNKIEKIIKNWDKYKEKDRINRCSNILYMVERYIDYESSKNKCYLNDKIILYRVAEELGVYDLIKKYDEDIEYLQEYYEDEEYDELLKLGIESLGRDLNKDISIEVIYDNVKKIIMSQLYDDKPLTLEELGLVNNVESNYRRKNIKCKVMKYNYKKDNK